MFGTLVEIVHVCPFMVSIMQYVHNSVRHCGGSVLTNTLTLTAAHCLLNGTRDMNLRYGSANLFTGGTLIPATRIIIHNSFERDTLAKDIGLVSIFPATVGYSVYIQPVTLPKNSTFLAPNKQITVYGWGSISHTQTFSIKLRRAIIPIVDRHICRRLIQGIVPKDTFCLGYPYGQIDTCEGDSGGPAMLSDEQVGIISFGEGCGLPLKPGVYTDVTKHLDWIHKAIYEEP